MTTLWLVSVRLHGWNLAEASWEGEVRNIAVLVAIGVNEDGFREILGVSEEAKEDSLLA